MDDKPYVLVVDDDPEMRTLMIHLMDRLGVDVKVAADGTEALAFVRRKSPPGLVLLDLNMPNVDGFTVLSRLQLDIEKRHIPVIVVTGEPLSEDEIASLGSLATAVLRKGRLDLREVAQLIEEHLKPPPLL